MALIYQVKEEIKTTNSRGLLFPRNTHQEQIQQRSSSRTESDLQVNGTTLIGGKLDYKPKQSRRDKDHRIYLKATYEEGTIMMNICASSWGFQLY